MKGRKKKKIFHFNRFTNFSETTQILIPRCSTSNSTTLNKLQHDDIVCTSLSSKKLKLNLGYQSTRDDTNRDEILIDNSIDDHADVDDDKESCRTRFYEQRDSSFYLLIDSDILQAAIQTIGKCPIENYVAKVEIKHNLSKNNRFALKLWIFVCYM